MGTGSFIDINTGSYPHASVAGKTETWVTVKKSSLENLSADCRLTLGRQITDRFPTGYRLVVCVYGKTCRLSVVQLSADSQPSGQSAEKFFGELFFTITKTSADITLALRNNASRSTMPIF